MLVKKDIPIVTIEKGKVIGNFSASADCDDWLYMGRLRKKAKAGNKEAIKELASINVWNVTVEEVPDEE